MKWVYIQWEDSQAQQGWCSLDGQFDKWVSLGNLFIETIGFLICENDRVYVVSSHYDKKNDKDHFDSVHSPMIIPKRSVVEFREIGEPSPPEIKVSVDTSAFLNDLQRAHDSVEGLYSKEFHPDDDPINKN